MPVPNMNSKKLVKQNCRLARRLWPSQLRLDQLRSLAELTDRYRLSVSAGHLLLLEGLWYVTHVGLLDYAKRHHCLGIQVEPVPAFCDAIKHQWAFKATAFVSSACK